MRARLQPGLLVAAVVLCVLLLWRSTQHAGLQPSSSPTSSSPTSSPHAAPTRPKRSSAAAPEASPPLPLPDPRERGGYTFWSTDYHIAPIADLADLFRSLCAEEKLCMSVIEQSFSGACGRTFGGRTPTCAGDALRVIDKSNAFELCSGEVGPHAIRRAFYEAYRGPHSGLQHVDAFVCNHPPALCELYMPFNKSIVVFASVNLEFARENGPRWKEWLTSLRRIAADPRNVIAANNLCARGAPRVLSPRPRLPSLTTAGLPLQVRRRVHPPLCRARGAVHPLVLRLCGHARDALPPGAGQAGAPGAEPPQPGAPVRSNKYTYTTTTRSTCTFTAP
jgi:hypothetical protein